MKRPRCLQCGKALKPPRWKFCSRDCTLAHTAERTRAYGNAIVPKWRRSSSKQRSAPS